MATRTNYVLVDYENVQPTDLALLRDGPFRVRVFLGANQAKIPVSLAAALQAFGTNAEYVLLEASGANALDFHIAYYIGVLSAKDPTAFFHIISKDTGFDPLIKHLMGKGIYSQRSSSIAGMPHFKTAVAASDDERTAAIVAYLTKQKAAKPRTRKTLVSTLNVLFKNNLSEPQLSDVVDHLCKRGIVKLEGARVSYNLPGAA